MSDRQATASHKALVPAIRDLTEGTTDLIRHHFELLRIELKREASEAGERSGVLLAGAGVALLGYGLVNLTIVLFFGWLFASLGAMTLAALGLGVAHLGIGGWLTISRLGDFREQQRRLERKTRTLTGTQPWLEENPES